MDRTALLRLAVAGALAALSGCALAPPPDPEALRAQAMPNAKPPEHWAAAQTAPGEVRDGWLASFGDPALDALVAEAVAHNPDLKIAAARVEAAEASARAAGYPEPISECARKFQKPTS